MTLTNAHHPVEIFGYPVDNKSKNVTKSRNNYKCPFLNDICNKQSRLIDYPMGVCTVLHLGNKIPICPQRLLQDSQVFIDICNDCFGGVDNVLLFAEVGLKNVGTFDFILVKHKPISSKVEDFCAVEFQTDSTTGTGQLVKALTDFMDGKDVTNHRYRYGMNTYNTIKLSFTQMMVKGQVFEQWNKKIYWIEPSYVFENMVQRFNLQDLEYSKRDNNIYFIYNLVRDGDIYRLRRTYQRSTTTLNLLHSFTQRSSPDIKEFIITLEEKISLDIGLTLG